MRLRDPLVPVFLALAAGVVAGRVADDVPVSNAVGAGLGLSCLTLIAHRWVTRRSAWVAGLASLFCAGVALESWHRQGPLAPGLLDFTPGETVQLAGCVVEPVAASADREQMVLELKPGARVRVNWYLKEGETAPGLRYGQRVEIEAKVRKPRNYANPGSFDFAGYLARRDIYWTATANANSAMRITGADCGRWPLTWVYAARQAAITRLDELYAQDRYALGMTRALLVGDTAMLERVWADDFRRTGTYHALVISGLHLTLLTGWFLFFLRIVSAGVGWSLVLTSGVAWFYTVLAGGGAPVGRAAAGLTLYLAGRCLFREPRVLNLLAAVAIGYVAVDPGSLFEASFQLSFLSVAMIGAVAAPLLERTLDPYARGMRRLGEERWDIHLAPRVASLRIEMRLLAETAYELARLPRRLTLGLLDWSGRAVFYALSLLTVSAVVQAGLLLPMVAYFHRLSVTGLTANLLIVPCMNAVVLTGFAAVLTGWHWLGWVAAVPLQWARAVAGWHAALEPPVRLADPPAWLVAAFLVSLVVVWIAMQFSRWRWRLLASSPWFGCLGLLVAQPFEPSREPGHFEVTTLDVGQGDGLLIGSPGGKWMLVDAGGFPVFGKPRQRPARPPIDVGEEVVSTYLFHRGIRQVDIVVATHAHEDHIGGLRAVIENFRPRQLWTGAFPETESWRTMRAWIESRGVKIVAPKARDKLHWDGVEIAVLSPPPGFGEGAGVAANNDSLVMRLRFGERSVLLTGDVEKQMELRMVDEGLVAATDILKVAHHGSKTSTTPEFLDAARPLWAIISAGEANLFRHPHPQVVERLEAFGTEVWRTDTRGQIRMLTDGRRGWRIEAYRWPAAEQPGRLQSLSRSTALF